MVYFICNEPTLCRLDPFGFPGDPLATHSSHYGASLRYSRRVRYQKSSTKIRRHAKRTSYTRHLCSAVLPFLLLSVIQPRRKAKEKEREAEEDGFDEAKREPLQQQQREKIFSFSRPDSSSFQTPKGPYPEKKNRIFVVDSSIDLPIVCF